MQMVFGEGKQDPASIEKRLLCSIIPFSTKFLSDNLQYTSSLTFRHSEKSCNPKYLEDTSLGKEYIAFLCYSC